jgi:hypothetical protein
MGGTEHESVNTTLISLVVAGTATNAKLHEEV